jgi:catechol 2,3-dioxygenase-like lactoylglutathione lyase family enzyme
MVQYVGIHHPAFGTCDLEGTIRFWRDLLGMRMVYTTNEGSGRQIFFSVGGGSYIVFFEWPDACCLPYRRHGEPKSGEQAFDHVSIQVADEEQLWEIMSRLDASGMPAGDIVDHGFCRSLYSYDPNKIPIEFLCMREDVDLKANPVFADPEPLPAMLEGADPVPGHWPDSEEILLEEREINPGASFNDFPLPEDPKR